MQLNIPKTYKNSEILFEADLDNFKEATETALNDTLLDEDNFKDDGITGSTKLVNASISEEELAADSITETRLADDAITTAKIQDASVTSDTIADGTVALAKFAAPNIATGSDFNFSASDEAVNTVSSVTITVSANARPVIICVVPDASGVCAMTGTLAGTTGLWGNFLFARYSLFRDSTFIGEYSFAGTMEDSAFGTDGAVLYLPTSSIWMFDTGVAAGSVTYTLKYQGRFNDAPTSFAVTAKGKLLAYELI